MPQTIEALRLFQWGKESVRGTIVPATSKLAVDNIEFAEEDSVHRPKLAKGLLHRNPGSETIYKRATKIKIAESEISYDQQQNFLTMGVKGGVTPTGGSPYLWTYARSLVADPAPDTATIERRLTDGATPADNKWGYCFLSSMTWKWELNKVMTFSAEGWGRRIQAATLTAALSLPTIEIPPTPLALAWIDAAWANLGTTAVLGQILRAVVTFRTGLKPKWTFDGRSDLDYTTYVVDARECGIDCEIDLLVQAAGQFATEKTAAEAQTARAVRLKVTGTAARYLQLDMLLKHERGSIETIGQDDGQDIVKLKLQDTDDGTNMFQAVVNNLVAALV